MNEFEKRMNDLRCQFKAERIRIQKDSCRTIGRLNNAIGIVASQEARDALRAEKARVYEATRQTMKDNRLCYHLQLEALNDEYRAHRDRSLSTRKLRQTMALLFEAAEAKGKKDVTVCFGQDKQCKISFS